MRTNVPGARLLGGCPNAKRVPGYPPKIAVNTREHPGTFSPKLSGTRLSRVLVG